MARRLEEGLLKSMTDVLPRTWCHDLGIVIPTFNAARFLPATLASLTSLIARGAQAIVVDGGSTDGTRDICDRMGMLMLHEERSGLYAALNKGFRRLNSAWLTWINADDILYPSGVSAYGDVLDAADIHYGTVDFIDADGRFLHAWRSASPQRLGSLYRAGCSPLLQQGTIFRRKVFERLDGFDSSMSYVGDADFWWRALEAGFGFRRLRYPTVAGFRLHDAQLSHVHAVEMRREHQDMVVARTGHASRWALSPTATAYRLSNASRYVVRLLRCRDVTGEFRLPRSYDAP